MAICPEKIKDAKTGQMVDKKVNGKIQYCIRTYVTGTDGKKHQTTRHNPDWVGRDGYWLAQQEENRLKSKNINIYEKITLDELFNMYFKEASNNLKKSTLRKINDNYNIHIKPYLGYKKVFNLTTKDILDFHENLNNIKNTINNSCSKRKVNEYHLSTAFKQSIHVTLVTILNFGCKYIGLIKNVASLTGNFKDNKGHSKKELNFLTVHEFKKFIEFEKNELYKDFFTLLFFTGMRRGELLALTTNDIDFVNNEININKSLNPKNGYIHTDPKTTMSNRKIKMLDIVKNVFIKYNSNENDKYIFGLENIKPTTLQRKCDNNCKLANINKNIRIHDFRHSFASMCIEKGVPIEITSSYLGHKKITTTLNIYAHLYPNSQDKLLSALNQLN